MPFALRWVADPEAVDEQIEGAVEYLVAIADQRDEWEAALTGIVRLLAMDTPCGESALGSFARIRDDLPDDLSESASRDILAVVSAGGPRKRRRLAKAMRYAGLADLAVQVQV
jgi:hypothetical protein